MPINDEIYVVIPNNGLLDHTDRHFRISKGEVGGQCNTDTISILRGQLVQPTFAVLSGILLRANGDR